MLKNILLIIFFSCYYSITGFGQTVFFVNAGSRASWGTVQELLIDVSGNCRYYLREVNGPVKDSSRFDITKQQLESLFAKAEESGFFNLNKIYNGGAADGAGIYISLNSSGKKHQVQLVNTDVPAVKDLIATLNTLLEPQKIIINYGQFVPK
jgi:hypothetical protein